MSQVIFVRKWELLRNRKRIKINVECRVQPVFDAIHPIYLYLLQHQEIFLNLGQFWIDLEILHHQRNRLRDHRDLQQ